MNCPACGAESGVGATACPKCGHDILPWAESLRPGSVLGERYEVLALLGKGGMGMVFKAKDRLLHEEVAVKLLRREGTESKEMAERFRSEIKLARAVSHRNVCRIHEYGEDRGISYISMAYVEGEDLKSLIRRQGRLAPARALEVALQVADALHAIHDEGIVHRDLKTANLMLDRRGVVKLMDFGIAKHWQAEGTSLTAVGQIVGTPEYMSPEQIRGERLDHRSDLYSLGIVIHELLTGKTPFSAETPVVALMRHLAEEIRLDGPAAEFLPAPVVPILRRALAKRPDDRFGSAREMAAALEQARQAVSGARAAGPDQVTVSVASVATRPELGPGPTVPAGGPTEAAPTIATTAVSAKAPPGPVRTPRLVWLAVATVLSITLVLIGFFWLDPLGVRSRPQPAAPAAETRTPAGPLVAAPAGSAADSGKTPARAETAGLAHPKSSLASPPPVTSSAPFTKAGPTTAVAPAAASPAAVASLDRLLSRADAEVDAGRYGAALDLYAEARALDPASSRARQGYDLCGEALAAARGPRPAEKSLVVTRLAAPSAPAAGPRGFEDAGAVSARRVEQAAPAPATVDVEVEPRAPKAGETFTVRVYLANEGGSALTVASMSMASTVNGRGSRGAVSPLTQKAPPRSRTLLYSVADVWKASTTSFTLSVEVRLPAGEPLRGLVEWR